MEFASNSKKWEVSAYPGSPEKLIRALLTDCAGHLPPDALGHLKAFIEFSGGSIFGSSTLTTPEITLRSDGSYSGGNMVLSVTLIFMDLKAEFLNKVLSKAVNEVCENLGCKFKEIMEVL
jgi:hypothetical protein